MSKQRGFTLIELVMVIVILGILAAVALPKFFDLSGQSAAAAVQGVAGAVSSGSAANFAAKKVGAAGTVTLGAGNMCTVLSLAGVVQGGLPAGYTITGTGDCASADSVTCTIAAPSPNQAQTAFATVYCAR